MRSIPPGNVRTFTLTRPNTQCRSVEKGHMAVRPIMLTQSQQFRPPWQVKKIPPIEMPLLLCPSHRGETTNKIIPSVEEIPVCPVKGKPWLGRFPPDLLPLPCGTDPPAARLHVRRSQEAAVPLAEPQTSPQSRPGGNTACKVLPCMQKVCC